MENKDLMPRLYEFRDKLEVMVSLFEDKVAIHRDCLKGANKEGKEYLSRQLSTDMSSLAQYIFMRDNFYKLFPELRPEEKRGML